MMIDRIWLYSQVKVNVAAQEMNRFSVTETNLINFHELAPTLFMTRKMRVLSNREFSRQVKKLWNDNSE